MTSAAKNQIIVKAICILFAKNARQPGAARMKGADNYVFAG
ncbi:hypothetical protein FAEPRAM212_02604 [Faecalibacterium prausnitzii M21/2]|uniref:Uncharacterized protein n=1 Tax=Faecalibacterium prausnitzii M21/2 TaxID=411485 RepID=A8SEY8_9FIRM|nr:hypothetical protein FAEPRAM212_02604 [Faecalibacterium prausnitzii M21/2]